MICQKCGNEIEEGKLICENCGADVQLIPSFEPEIEREIRDALANPYVDDEYEDEEDLEYIDDPEYYDENLEYEEEYPEEEYSEEEYSDEYEDQGFDEEYDGVLLDELDDFEDDEGDVLRQIALAVRQSRFRPLYIALCCILIIAVIISAVYVTKLVIHDNSAEYQAQMGMEAFDTGNYEAAITYMDRAHTLDSSFVIPEDVKKEAPFVLSHRIMTIARSHIDSAKFIRNMLDEIPVPMEDVR